MARIDAADVSAWLSSATEAELKKIDAKLLLFAAKVSLQNISELSCRDLGDEVDDILRRLSGVRFVR
jgi:hypothetical protein